VVAVEDRAQLRLDPHLLSDDPLAVAHKRAQLGELGAGGQQRSPAIVLMAESVRERVGVEGVVLRRRHPIALPQPCRQARVDRVDAVPEREQLLDQQPLRSLERDRQADAEAGERGRELLQARTVVRGAKLEATLTRLVDHARLMVLTSPVDANEDP